eukprot:scaffold237112_cov24-Prasinocladus_malaysianus.AAC.1
MAAAQLILPKIPKESSKTKQATNENGDANETESLDEPNRQSELRIAVPAMSCGAIIGKGGANIAQFRSDSGASIRILPHNSLIAGDYCNGRAA